MLRQQAPQRLDERDEADEEHREPLGVEAQPEALAALVGGGEVLGGPAQRVQGGPDGQDSGDDLGQEPGPAGGGDEEPGGLCESVHGASLSAAVAPVEQRRAQTGARALGGARLGPALGGHERLLGGGAIAD